MSEGNDSLVVYADYVCPFCYLGRVSLMEYIDGRDSDLVVEWRPFDLRRHKRGPTGEIDHSIDDGKDEEYFNQVRQNVSRLKERYDADEMLGFDDLPDGVDSFNAQVVSLYVRDEHPEMWWGFDEAIYNALWVDGRDIGDPDVLAGIAGEVGLGGDEIRGVVESDECREETSKRFWEAHEEGITGVPTYIYDEYTARGTIPPSQFRRLIEGTE